MLKLQGIHSSLTTPFDHAGGIYRVKVRHNVEKANLVKLSGYVVCGSAGEGPHLAADERVEMWQLAAEAAAEGRTLIAGVQAESVHEAVALANRAAESGYAAALVTTPRYYRHQVEDRAAQELFFGAVADRSKLPVIVNNTPRHTGVDLAAESIAKLSEHPNIAAVCEGSGMAGKLNWILREVDKAKCAVLTGSGANLWPALDLGAAGGILSLAAAAPYACITIWEAHRMREREAAEDWQARIAKPVELVTLRYGVPGLKYAMDLNGYYGGPCRLPLRPLAPEAKAEIEQAFDGIRG